MTTSTIQLRRDTAANWTSKNTVLALGEPGRETDTGRAKLGDGSTAWSSLPYDDAVAKTYADTQDKSNLTTAKAYSDTQDTTNLTSAKAYSDTQDKAYLVTAKAYADAQDSTYLVTAKSYADAQDKVILATAKSYADSVAAGSSSSSTSSDFKTLSLWQTFDTVALMKAGATSTYPRVKWRGYNFVGDGGGGEGIYVSGTYTADEGTVFATTAGGYVLRDIPAGDVQTPWFGMTAISGPANTLLNPTTSAAPTNPTTDFASNLRAAGAFAALAGRSLHIVGRAGWFQIASQVTFPGVRKVYGDGPKLDAKWGTQINYAPATITDLDFGIGATDENQTFEDMLLTSTDPVWGTSVASNTLISGGYVTLPSGFVFHTDTLPWSATKPGIAALGVTNKCNLRNVNTSGGKIGVIVNNYTGHVTFEYCNIDGGFVGRLWQQNGQDHLILGGSCSGWFAAEGIFENGWSGQVNRYHQFHRPVGWYQFNYSGATPSGIYLDGVNLSVEHMNEAWIMMGEQSHNNRIKSSAGGDLFAYALAATETDAYNLSTVLEDAWFANSTRRMYSCGRFGGLDYYKTNLLPNSTIVAQGGTGTYSHRVRIFAPDMGDSDISVMGALDYSAVTGTVPYINAKPLTRAVTATADRSVSGVARGVASVGNIIPGTIAYSSANGLGYVNNALVANGGGWTLSSGNSSYPGTAELDTLANFVAGVTRADGSVRAAVALTMPPAIADLVGLNPMVMAVTNSAPSGTSASVQLTISPSINNVADGQQGVAMSMFVAGNLGLFLNTSSGSYNVSSTGGTGSLKFEPIIAAGLVIAKSGTVQRLGINANTSASVNYVIAPQVNFGALAPYNPHQHAAAVSPLYAASGFRQAGRAFVTTTASGGATTAVTIADFLVSVDTTAAAGTTTLPSAPFDGEVHVIKKSDTSANTLTINGNGKLIDGSSTLVLAASVRSSARIQYVATLATPGWIVT